MLRYSRDSPLLRYQALDSQQVIYADETQECCTGRQDAGFERFADGAQFGY